PNTAVVIDSGLTSSEEGSVGKEWGTGWITNFVSGQDVLAFTSNAALYGNITAIYNSGTGVLSLSSAGATETGAQWQAALASVTYNNTSHNPTTTDRTISFVANDGTLNSVASTKTVSLTPTDTLPVVTDTGGATSWAEATGTGPNTAVVIDSGLTVTDLDNTTLASATVSITTFLSAHAL